jgi:hypothetical protein
MIFLNLNYRFRKMSYLDVIKKEKIPNNYWENIDNIKHFLGYCCLKLNVEKVEDWYKCSRKNITELGGGELFNLYKNLVELLNKIYKEHYIFYEWKFSVTPNGFWNNIDNQKSYMDWLFKELKYENMEDWYKISQEIIKKNYGAGLIFVYNGSYQNILKNIYPYYNWIPWKFNQVPVNYWNDIENHKNFMDWLFKELNYQTMEDWYKLTNDIMEKNYGSSLLLKYKYSPYNILTNIYPEYNWYQWKFQGIPSNYWENENNRNEYKFWVFEKLNILNEEDCYKLNRKIIEKNNGYGFMRYYGNLENFLIDIYPDYKWIPWKFSRVPNNFWNSLENRKSYTDWLFEELKYKNQEDWYKINCQDFHNNYGAGMLYLFYNNSATNCIINLYKDLNLLPWKFNCEKGYWDKVENQKEYMDWLYKELKYETMEDWYKLKQEDLRNNNGHGLLGKQNKEESFLPNLLNKIYPDYNFLQWKFISVGPNFWRNIENQKEYMNWLYKELKYEIMEDWYKLSQYDIKNNHGSGLLYIYVSLSKLIINIYPEYNWDESKFKNLKGETICNNFLEENYKDIIWGFYTNWCKNEKTDRHFPFDFCIEEYKNIIEIDGEQHFEEIKQWKNNPKENRERDKYKMECANKNGYTIIRILWEDIYEDKNDWKEKLKEAIKLYDIPSRIYLSNKYKEYEEYN